MNKAQRWPAHQRFVIILTSVLGNGQVMHYGQCIRHLAVGSSDERVVYSVVNGGWTAGVYKDGRRTVGGKFPNYLSHDRYAVTHFQEVNGYGADYQEAILSVIEQMERP